MTLAVVSADPTHIIETWFRSLYRYCEGWITLFSVERDSGARFTDWARTNEPDALAATAVTRARTCDVWYGVATRKERLSGNRRGGAADCLHIPGLWADIDILGPNHAATNLPPDLEAAVALLADFPLPPTATVHSGGGIQPLWLLSEPLAADEADELLERWTYTWGTLAERRGWQIDNVWDIARVMRVPGTQNRKNTPVDVAIIDANRGLRYGTDDLDQYTVEPPAKVTDVRRPMPYIGPQRPGDAFNAARSGAEVLEAAGFSLERTDLNGDRHYHAPGAANATGATVYADDGHTTIWSETAVARWPTLALRRPYDAFGLYSHLNHRGDWVAASDALERLGYGSKNVGELPAIVGGKAEVEVEGEGSSPVLHILSAAELVERVENAPPVGWLARPVWPGDAYGVMAAEQKAGKTWANLDLVVSVASGTAWMGTYPIDRAGTVLVFLGEGGERKMKRRLDAICAQRGLKLADLPIRLCFRVPHLTNLEHLGLVDQEVHAHRPSLIVVDPLYLAARGAKTGLLNEMGEHLERLQHVAQGVGAALLIVHHWNKTGEGKGAKRMTGAGGAEWGRVLVSVSVRSKHTDKLTRASTTLLDFEFEGDEIPDTALRIKRQVWSEVPDDIDSPMHYVIEMVADDEPEVDEEAAAFSPSTKRILAVLRGAEGAWLTVGEIGDQLADAGHPLKKRTIQSGLKELAEDGLAVPSGDAGTAFSWRYGPSSYLHEVTDDDM